LIEFHELGKIELGLLEDLNLADKDILKREDLWAVLLNLLADLFREYLFENILKGWFSSLSNHDFHHLLAKLLLVGCFSVAGGLNLVSVTAGESNCEHSNEVTIGSFSLDESLNSWVPLFDKRTEFIAGDVHSMEVGVAVEALDFFNLDLHLSPCDLMSIVVKFTKWNSENTSTEGFTSDL